MWGRGGESGENGYIHTYGKSLYCPPETHTTLLIGYTLTENGKLKNSSRTGSGKYTSKNLNHKTVGNRIMQNGQKKYLAIGENER